MSGRVAFWLALFIVGAAIWGLLSGCATLAEQDTQRRVAIDHEIRIGRLERAVYEPAPPEWQHQPGDGR